MTTTNIITDIGKEKEGLLTHASKKIAKDLLHFLSLNFIANVFVVCNPYAQTLCSFVKINICVQLAGIVYLYILLVCKGVQHSAGKYFAANPIYFYSENIIKLPLEGDCNVVACTIGGVMLSRKYAQKITFIVRLKNYHLFAYANKFDQIKFALVRVA